MSRRWTGGSAKSRRCKAKNKAGMRCGRWASPGCAGFCTLHVLSISIDVELVQHEN